MQNQPGNLAIKTEKRCKGCIYFEPDVYSTVDIYADMTRYLILCANRDFCENIQYIDKVILPGFTGKED